MKSIHRVREVLEQCWRHSHVIYSYEMSNVLKVFHFTMRRCVDRIREQVYRAIHQS